MPNEHLVVAHESIGTNMDTDMNVDVDVDMDTLMLKITYTHSCMLVFPCSHEVWQSYT